MPQPGDLAGLDAVFDWINQRVAPLPAEESAPANSVHRVLAEPVFAEADMPPHAEAAVDGFAVRAEDTVGASTYSPVIFRLESPVAPLSPFCAAPLGIGEPLPQSADAVVPRDHLSPDMTGGCEITETVASGNHVVRKGSWAKRGSVLLAAGRQVQAHDLGVLLAASVGRVRVVGQPRVRILLTGPQHRPEVKAAPDTNGPVLQKLIARDGGSMNQLRPVERARTLLIAALSEPGSDLILVVGITGAGADDCAPAAVAGVGQLAFHGIALNPGETTGLGQTTAGVPVFLLPGSPSACLWAYELVASRAVRRLAGRDPAFPFPSKQMRTQRKIISNIGLAEICLVQCDGGVAKPISSFGDMDPVAVAHADGFVIVPEGSEGYREGSTVTVHLLRPCGTPPNGPPETP